MEVGQAYSKIKCRKPNWFIAEPNKLKFCMKMLFLSANQEVDHGKIKESYLLFYGDTPPPPPPPSRFRGLWEGQRQNQQKAVYSL